MPLKLDKIDIKIIESLLEDGRKSFRQISRETGITTPTVIARYERLINVGFIKCVLPIFDFEKVEFNEKENLLQIQNIKENMVKRSDNMQDNALKRETSYIGKKIINGLAIRIVCDYCGGFVYGKSRILKFANIERFFCCTSCKSEYGKKYHGRIESIKRKYDGRSEMDF